MISAQYQMTRAVTGALWWPAVDVSTVLLLTFHSLSLIFCQFHWFSWKSTINMKSQWKAMKSQTKNGWHIHCRSSEGAGHRPRPLILCANHPQSTPHYSKRPGGNQRAWGALNRSPTLFNLFVSFLTFSNLSNFSTVFFSRNVACLKVERL